MTNDQCPKSVRFVAGALIFIEGIFVIIGAFTQSVGINLGALVFITTAMIWPARAMLRCENWGRIGYLFAGPFAFWMSLQALRDAEFLQDFLYLLMLIGGALYLVALVVLMQSKTRKIFLASTLSNESRSFGKGLSVLLISFAGFLFAWWWTNLSTALHLISTGDLQSILISIGGIFIGTAFGVLGIRIWWTPSWRTVTGFVLLATGWVLLEHALCYSGITALVYLGGSESAFGATGLIIGGRFLFAVFALGGGTILMRLPTKKMVAIGEKTMSVSSLNQRQEHLRQSIFEKAVVQSRAAKVDIVTEAECIAANCSVFTKERNPAHYTDVILQLLAHPNELACSIVHQFTNFTRRMPYNPFGTTMIAFAQMDSLYPGGMFRFKMLKENPLLGEVAVSKETRLQRCGEILAIALLALSQTVGDAREIYRTTPFDSSIRSVVDKTLRDYDVEIAEYIKGIA